MPRVLPHDEAAARPLTSRSNKTEGPKPENDQRDFKVAGVAAGMC